MSDRQEFEEWYLSLHGSTRYDLHAEPEGDAYMAKGSYYDLGARMMWQAYQAAHKAQQAEIERLKADVEFLVKFTEFKYNPRAMRESLEGNQ